MKDEKIEKIISDIIFLENLIKQKQGRIARIKHIIDNKLIPEGLDQKLLDKEIVENEKTITEHREKINLFLKTYPEVDPTYILHCLTK